MSHDGTRTRERSTDGEVDIDVGLDDVGVGDGVGGKEAPADTADGLRGRLSRRARRLFSPRAFLVALGLSVAGLLVAGSVVPLPGAGLLGVFAAAFLLGLAAESSRYAETAAAGAVAVGASTLADLAVVAFLGGFGLPLAALGAGVGAAVGAVGCYFGRDLRDGLTREV